jgi:hypothetical protein
LAEISIFIRKIIIGIADDQKDRVALKEKFLSQDTFGRQYRIDEFDRNHRSKH